MNAQEQAREVKRYILCIDEHLPDGADMEESQLGSWCKWSDIRSLLASLESVTADAECMAEAWDNQSHSTYTKYSKRICTCPACTTARKYRRGK